MSNLRADVLAPQLVRKIPRELLAAAAAEASRSDRSRYLDSSPTRGDAAFWRDAQGCRAADRPSTPPEAKPRPRSRGPPSRTTIPITSARPSQPPPGLALPLPLPVPHPQLSPPARPSPHPPPPLPSSLELWRLGDAFRNALRDAAGPRPLSLAQALDAGACQLAERRLSAVQLSLTSVGALPPSKLRTVRTAFLSRNSLSSFRGLSQLPALSALSAGDNLVSSLAAIDELAKECPHLRSLSLDGNPVSRLAPVRAYAVARLPHLELMDGAPVTSEERRAAPAAVRQDEAMAALLLSAACALRKVEVLIARVPLHLELLKALGGPTAARGAVAAASALDSPLLMRVWDLEARIDSIKAPECPTPVVKPMTRYPLGRRSIAAVHTSHRAAPHSLTLPRPPLPRERACRALCLRKTGSLSCSRSASQPPSG